MFFSVYVKFVLFDKACELLNTANKKKKVSSLRLPLGVGLTLALRGRSLVLGFDFFALFL